MCWCHFNTFAKNSTWYFTIAFVDVEFVPPILFTATSLFVRGAISCLVMASRKAAAAMKSTDRSTFVRKTLTTVFCALLIDILAFTIILPLFPRLLEHYEKVDGTNEVCSAESGVETIQFTVVMFLLVFSLFSTSWDHSTVSANARCIRLFDGYHLIWRGAGINVLVSAVRKQPCDRFT